jgi:hypothetical protein
MVSIDQLRDSTPIVVELDRKKKRKYSKNLSRLQKTGRRLGRIAEKSARGNKKGASKFRELSEESAREKKDGAIRDLPRNAVKGLRAAAKESGSVPIDLARTLVPRRRKSSRSRSRTVSARVRRALGIK